jgi:hypothetical protein
MITISFDEVRLGTMYRKYGTVIAMGDVVKNEDFCNYSNQLCSFLLKDKDIESVLGANFRRNFPTVWYALGYYNM